MLFGRKKTNKMKKFRKKSRKMRGGASTSLIDSTTPTGSSTSTDTSNSTDTSTPTDIITARMIKANKPDTKTEVEPTVSEPSLSPDRCKELYDKIMKLGKDYEETVKEYNTTLEKWKQLTLSEKKQVKEEVKGGKSKKRKSSKKYKSSKKR
jgi:hypothetical protein